MGINQRNQRGMSINTWIVIIAVTLFFMMLGMKMIPSYMEFYSIKEILASIEKDPQYKSATLKAIRKTFEKRININGIYDFERNSLQLSRGKGETTVAVDYEVRKEMAGNVSVIMHFQHQVVF